MSLRKINHTPIHKFNYCQIPNHDFNFVLLNDKGDRFLHSWFTCKDYLQDIWWVENTGEKGKELYGLKWNPGQLDIKRERFELALHGGKVKLREWGPKLQQFLNQFEDAQGFKRTEVIPTVEDEMVIVNFSNEWVTSGPLLSAFTTLIRLAGAYAGEEAMEYLESPKPNEPAFMRVEVERLGSTKKRLKALLKGKKVELPWGEVKSIGAAHGTGVVGWGKFPVEE